MDDLKKEDMDLMQDPQTRAKIEDIAKSRGISLDAAKEHFLNTQSNTDSGENASQNR